MSDKSISISGYVKTKLSRLHMMPKQLFGAGDDLEELLAGPVVAIVGTRKPTAYGRAVTSQLASALVRRGVVIISGLALGIDGLAHQYCLEAGGRTIAVLPTGLGAIYPRSHHALAERICRQGLLLSEYPGSEPPHRYHFLERNRLIAALADAVLIPEAAERSGSLVTAGYAIDMGIPVLAVPGNITSPTSGGTNRLLATGAAMVLSEQSLLEQLGLPTSDNAIESDNASETILLNLLRQGIHDGGELARGSRLDAAEYSQSMTMLELRGAIRPLGNDKWSLR